MSCVLDPVRVFRELDWQLRCQQWVTVYEMIWKKRKGSFVFKMLYCVGTHMWLCVGGVCVCVYLCWFEYTCMGLSREIRVWHQASHLLFPFCISFLRNMTQFLVAILVDYIFALDRPPWKKTRNTLLNGWFFLSLSVLSFLNIGKLMEMLQWLIHR